MLMEVKNQFRVTALSIKYALEREMLNKVTFITNIIFMILNNASFIIQWIIIYSIKDNVGGYTFKQVLLLWGMAALTYAYKKLDKAQQKGLVHANFVARNKSQLAKLVNTLN